MRTREEMSRKAVRSSRADSASAPPHPTPPPLHPPPLPGRSGERRGLRSAVSQVSSRPPTKPLISLRSEETRDEAAETLRDSPSSTASLAWWLRRSAPELEPRTRGSIPAFPTWIFPGRVIPVTSLLVLQWLSCLASDVIGSALGLASPSVYCEWMREKVCFPAFPKGIFPGRVIPVTSLLALQ